MWLGRWVGCMQTTDPSTAVAVQQVRKRAAELEREVGLCVHMLEKKAASTPRGAPQAASGAALLHRYGPGACVVDGSGG
jgi:hypothetical protein